MVPVIKLAFAGRLSACIAFLEDPLPGYLQRGVPGLDLLLLGGVEHYLGVPLDLRAISIAPSSDMGTARIRADLFIIRQSSSGL